MRRLLFLGSKEAGFRALERLIVQLPPGTVPAIICPDDRTDARSVHQEFLVLAKEYNIPLHIVNSVKETNYLIAKYEPDTVLVHGWYRMIPVRQFPTIDFLGFHFSPLPRYRGNAPLVWQILNDEVRLGVSFFTLTEGMDNGDLVDQSMFDLLPHEDIFDALRKANEQVAAMLDRFVPRWLEGSVAKYPQPPLSPSYCGLRIPEDGRIDWKQSSKQIQNFIRAQGRPYSGAFTLTADDEVVRIWRSSIDTRQFLGVPGSVVEVSSDTIVVACGIGAITISVSEMSCDPDRPFPVGLRSLKVRFK